MTVKNHVVVLREYERGWGSKDFLASSYDTKEEAMKQVNHVNSYLTESRAPDYYIKARYVDEMTDTEFESINS